MLSRRSVTTLPLDPLSDEVMGEVLDGLVTDLPQPRARIVERAEGIPLYAIETVRGLLDKGVLEKGDDGLLHLRSELGELEIPPGLTALIASRLDALGVEERRLVKECSVLGGSFPRQAVEAVSDIDPAELGELLSSLVRKEVLTVRADKFSPERGQYAFTQSLIRSVAYDMLTRVERKARHLRTAEHLRTAFPDEGAEVAEVIAHTFTTPTGPAETMAIPTSCERGPPPPTCGRRTSRVRRGPGRCRDRLHDRPRAEHGRSITGRAGREGRADGHPRRILRPCDFSSRGGYSRPHHGWTCERRRPGHGAVSRRVLQPRPDRGVDRPHQAGALLGWPDTLPPAVVAELQAFAGAALAFIGQSDEASARLDDALVLSQQHEVAKPLAVALNFKAYLLGREGRVEEAGLLLEGSLAVAKRHVLEFQATAENNLAWFLFTHDLPGAEEHLHAALGLARRLGARSEETIFAHSLMDVLIILGRFDEAEELGTDVLGSSDFPQPGTPWLHLSLGYLDALRGRIESAREHVAHFEQPPESAPLQAKVGHGYGRSVLALAEGDFRTALDEAWRVLNTSGSNEGTEGLVALRECLPIAIDAALALPAIEEAEALVDVVAARPPGATPPFLRAQLHRACALVSAARGDTGDVEAGLEAAEKGFRDLNYPYWTARVQLDLAEWLARRGRVNDSARIAIEASATFERLGAAPVLAQARAHLEPEMVRDSGADEERAVAQSRSSLSD